MARSARRYLLGLVPLALLLLTADACGLDAVGALEASDAAAESATTLPDGAPLPADAAPAPDADATTFSDGAIDVGPGPCDDPAIVLCVGFDGTLSDAAHAQPLQKSGTVTFVPGVVGQAVQLDATSALTLADGPAWTYAKLTVETWVRLDEIPTGGARAGLLDKDNSFGAFVYAGGLVSCFMNAAASAIVLPTTGQWVHIACVNDGASTTLYADGLPKATVASAPVALTTSLVAIGNNSPSLGSPLVGALDLLRVYSRAKTAAEIAADAKR
jgi:hypothetical protein